MGPSNTLFPHEAVADPIWLTGKRNAGEATATGQGRGQRTE